MSKIGQVGWERRNQSLEFRLGGSRNVLRADRFPWLWTNMTKHRVPNLHLRPSSALMHAKYGVALRWVDRRKAIGYCVSLPGRMSKYVNLYWNMPLIWRWRNDG